MSSAKSAASPEVGKARKAGGRRPKPAAIEDDLDLLDLFLGDMRDQQDIWKPTAYWLDYCDRITAEIRRSGLKDFRRNWNLIKGYGNTPVGERFEAFQSDWARKAYALVSRLPPFRMIEWRHGKQTRAYDRDLARWAYYHALLLHAFIKEGEHAAPILDSVEDSSVGNPVVFDLDGRKYSSNLLRRITTVAVMLQCAPEAPRRRILEIGGGYGVMPEILMKLDRGDIDYFVALDIPPIVHIQTQYLKSVFPGRVMDYRAVRDMPAIRPEDIAGSILVIPPWMLPRLDLDFDLLYNSISFQEMEPAVVENYLDLAAPRSSRVFINSKHDGHKKGARGQQEQISFKWLADEIEKRGFRQDAHPTDTPEARAFAADLPGYRYGHFSRAG